MSTSRPPGLVALSGRDAYCDPMPNAVLASVLLLLSSPAWAAAEFLRFTGSVVSWYGPFHYGYEPSLGLAPDQPLYFDFTLNTDLVSLDPYPSRPWPDTFHVRYIGGSLGEPRTTSGITRHFVEGSTTWLGGVPGLLLGTPWLPESFGDMSITTWAVGDKMALMSKAYISSHSVAELTLVHRASTPPAPVPAPPSALLSLTAFLSMAGFRRIRRRVTRSAAERRLALRAHARPIRKALLATVLALIAAPAPAAPEYLRFSGATGSGTGQFPYDYRLLGLTANQPIYFDFFVDTAIDATSNPDMMQYFDNFHVEYLGGSVASDYRPNYGLNGAFPEGETTWLYITPTLFVGSIFGPSTGFGDRSIGNWALGDEMALMHIYYYPAYMYTLGDLTLSYRGAVAPPAMVPAPAAAPLFATGLLLVARLARTRRARSSSQRRQ